jgi:Ca2+-binding EF-hand superfamily protein
MIVRERENNERERERERENFRYFDNEKKPKIHKKFFTKRLKSFGHSR